MFKLGLIGKNISYSFSRNYFENKFKEEIIQNISYENFDIENIDLFPSLFKNNKNIKGFNVTIPYKEAIIPYLDELSHESQKTQSVNTIYLKDNKVVGQGWNLSILQHDACAHAEIMAIREAGKVLQNYRLIDCTLYVTLEPCPMCAGALSWSQITKVVYGARDDKRGFKSTNESMLHPKTVIVGGVMEDECKALIQDFFKQRRAD